MPTKRTASLLVGIPILLLLVGCGSASKPTGSVSQPSGYTASYPAQYKEAFFKAHECGSGGYTVANCECQITYVEAHAPYSSLEEGAPEHAKAEEAMNRAGSTCSEETHTPAEEAAHNKAAEAQQQYNRAYSEQEQKDKPEEEHLHELEEKARYEHGE
jgi:hypothetical protein